MEEPRANAVALARGLAAFWEKRLGLRLCGFYLLGSLAHGGYSARWSDIDVGLVADGGVREEDTVAMRAEAGALSPALATRVSLFWADREFTRGRFPPLDICDYLDHAVPLAERRRATPPRPSLAEIRAYLAGGPFASFAAACEKFAAATALDPADRKPFLRVNLYPARLLYSWAAGGMESNDAAVAFLEKNPPAGLDLGLIARALRCRHAESDPDPLFPERGRLLLQRDACARALAG